MSSNKVSCSSLPSMDVSEQIAKTSIACNMGKAAFTNGTDMRSTWLLGIFESRQGHSKAITFQKALCLFRKSASETFKK